MSQIHPGPYASSSSENAIAVKIFVFSLGVQKQVAAGGTIQDGPRQQHNPGGSIGSQALTRPLVCAAGATAVANGADASACTLCYDTGAADHS